MAPFDAPEPRDPPRKPTTSSSRVTLARVTPDLYGFVGELETHPDLAYAWRLGGTTPRVEEVVGSSFDGVLAQFVAVESATGTPFGLVNCYRADHANGHAHVGAIAMPAVWNEGLMPEAFVVFVRYVFESFNFRKLYLESAEFNTKRLWSGASRLLTLEGCLREFLYYRGEYWNKYIFSVDRGRFENRFGEGGTLENFMFVVLDGES